MVLLLALLFTSSFVQETRQAAEFLELSQLLVLLVEMQQCGGTVRDGTQLQENHEAYLRRKLQDVCLDQGLFADIVFELDDGVCAAHKAMLAARCDVMKAMFGGDFRESQAKVVSMENI